MLCSSHPCTCGFIWTHLVQTSHLYLFMCAVIEVLISLASISVENTIWYIDPLLTCAFVLGEFALLMNPSQKWGVSGRMGSDEIYTYLINYN